MFTLLLVIKEHSITLYFVFLSAGVEVIGQAFGTTVGTEVVGSKFEVGSTVGEIVPGSHVAPKSRAAVDDVTIIV